MSKNQEKNPEKPKKSLDQVRDLIRIRHYCMSSDFRGLNIATVRRLPDVNSTGKQENSHPGNDHRIR